MGDEGEDQKEASGQEEDPGKMTPEEAAMLLDAFTEEETMDNLKKTKQRHSPAVLKDW